MLSDIEIAQNAKINPITQVAESIGIDTDKLELYGKYKAKLPLDYVENLPSNPNVKLILVTAMNPTPAGEGCPDGRHQSSLHRRHSCDHNCK